MNYKISFVNSDNVISFAASELKKYLRMMMPRCGEIKYSFNPNATDGFRMGLFEDFGMKHSVENTRLDDEVYFDCDENDGIIAGSNPRSVLLATYRYLKSQGCNWFFPGPDGEYIPIVEKLTPAKLRHAATSRYRGQCNEGAESQPLMMEAIDFTPKIGLNTFMIEFDIPKYYYQRAYQHKYDTYNPEASISDDQILQWKRECEAEISKRGLLFHDMGHGWTAEPFGFDSKEGWVACKEELPEEKRRHLAQINGVREFFGGVALNTNICMSNPESRKIMAEYIAEYAYTQNNVDFLHVWLADAMNNHCECENCITMTPSDWYVVLLNDIDKALTKRGCDTHIVFIAYVDTILAAYKEKIDNPDRFTLLFAPIGRKYTETYASDPDFSLVQPYKRNQLTHPETTAETMAYLHEWKKMWKGDCLCYEYHFWMPQYQELGGIRLAKTIYEDITNLKKHGLKGIIEDCSQSSFFPNGFSFYVYGETLFNDQKSFEELMEEYFSVAYGEDWKKVVNYLEEISYTSDFSYMRGEKKLFPDHTRFYNPAQVETYKKLPLICDGFTEEINKHLDSQIRTRYVHWEVLKWHQKYVKIISNGVQAVCVENEEEALKWYKKLADELFPLRFLRETVYDHELAMSTLRRQFDPNRKFSSENLQFEG